MRDLRVKEMTTAGVFGAIILFMSLVPAPWGLTWGFIRITGGIEITIIHIPVIIGGIFGGKRVAITLGAIFGVGSLLAALIYGGIFAPFFYNPLVSILPRVLFGYFIYLFYTNINKLVKNAYISMVLSMGLSTFAHSIMVLTMLYLFSFNSAVYLEYFGSSTVIEFMLIILGLNAVIEITLAVLVGTPIGLRIKEFKDQENI